MYDFLVSEVKQGVDKKQEAWPILIVDDEPAVHTITKFSLENETFEGKSFAFISAFNKEEAKNILTSRSDIALVLLDVVMETDTSGLDLAAWIRDELKNKLIRIILRTGQPGQAPERTVIVNYDIFDYKNKTELTAQKLFSCVISGLRSYRDVMSIANHSKGLQKVVESTADLFNKQYAGQYASGILLQLTSVLYHSADALLVNVHTQDSKTSYETLAVTGCFQHTDQDIKDIMPVNDINAALTTNESIYKNRENNQILFMYKSRDNFRTVLYLQYKKVISDDDMIMIELFVQSLAIAQERLRYWQETEDSLNEIIEALSKTFEKYAKKGDRYFTGVTKIAVLLARKHGLILKKKIAEERS